MSRSVYSEDLSFITNSFIDKKRIIENKLGDDILINQGLFVMVVAYFEDSVRELMKVMLVAFPEKLPKDSCTISRDQLCRVAKKGHSIIIDNELYLIFKDGVKAQLEILLKILFNKKTKNDKKISTKKVIGSEENEMIGKLGEISLYRNALIHNGGFASRELSERVRYYGNTFVGPIRFDFDLVKKFIDEYETFFIYLNKEISQTFVSFDKLSTIDKVKKLWNECFSSPMLPFEEYWEVDNIQDLVIDVRYPSIEGAISSSEQVLLSIWRHQFDDSIKTHEFLLCSVDYLKIFELYKGLDDLKFYHMQQKYWYNQSKMKKLIP